MPGKTDTFRGRRRQCVCLGSVRTLGLPQAKRTLRRSHSPCWGSSMVTGAPHQGLLDFCSHSTLAILPGLGCRGRKWSPSVLRREQKGLECL